MILLTRFTLDVHMHFYVDGLAKKDLQWRHLLEFLCKHCPCIYHVFLFRITNSFFVFFVFKFEVRKIKNGYVVKI